VHIVDAGPVKPVQNRIRIKDEPAKKAVSIKSAAGDLKFKKSKKETGKSKRITEPTVVRVQAKRAEPSPRINLKMDREPIKVCNL
jgi:hypothetical protein